MTNKRHIGSRGLALVKHFESCRLHAYKDPVGIWTIGWGHTGLKHNDGTVHKGRKIGEDEAHQLLSHDMRHFCQRVESLITIPLTDDQFDALVSFDFNTGSLAKSTLRQKLNAGDYEGAAMEFPKWNKAGGKVLRGLTRRRQSEQNLFLGKENYIIPA
jgi:lysozyme